MNQFEQYPNKKKAFKGPLKWLVRLLQISVLSYIGIVVLLVVNEPYLVYPASKYPRGNWKPVDFEFEEVVFDSKDGIKICGWFLPREGATENVLVCHGNAENVAQSSASTGRNLQAVLNANVFVFDYRGYGKSEGSPFEEAILNDTEAAMTWLNEKTQTTPDDIVVVGHSIGGGPAVHVAAKMGAKALCLQRTFASLVEPAQEKYWFIPVGLIMQNRYPSAEKIKSCDVPLHQSHGECDHLVPIDSGRKLFDCSPATHKLFFINRDAGHWDPLPIEYWRSLQEFVEQVNRNGLITESGQGPQ